MGNKIIKIRWKQCDRKIHCVFCSSNIPTNGNKTHNYEIGESLNYEIGDGRYADSIIPRIEADPKVLKA